MTNFTSVSFSCAELLLHVGLGMADSISGSVLCSGVSISMGVVASVATLPLGVAALPLGVDSDDMAAACPSTSLLRGVQSFPWMERRAFLGV